MKKTLLFFSMVAILLLGNLNIAFSQEQPAPKKDTVNMDTDAKPTFYYAEEDKANKPNGNSTTIAIIAGGVVILGAAGFFLLKKKK
jgi:LPXTG-motif cell wall-anchored protein